MAQEKTNNLSESNFNIRNYGSNDGLTLSSSNCVLQDKFGIIWVGTSDGLYQFDGYNFIVYKYTPEDSISISGNIINCISEDSKGNIWVGTDNGGLCVLDRGSMKFTRMPKLYWEKELYNLQSISSIIEDSNHNIWFSNSQFQYFILDRKTLHITPLKYDLLDRLPDYYRVTSMFEDKNKTIWMATQFGLYYSISNYQKVNNTLLASKIYKKIPELSFQTLRPNANSTDSIYLITSNGLFLSFNINNGAYKYVCTALSKVLMDSKEQIQSALIDRNNNWWVATYRGGLYLYNNKTCKIDHLTNDIYNRNSLSNNFLNNLYEDKNGNIWVCTDGGGLDRINPRASNFTIYQKSLFNKQSIANNDVWSIYANKDIILAGTSAGISYINQKTNQISNYDFIEKGTKQSAVAFYSFIKPDPYGNLWVGTDGEGLLRFDLKKKSFSRVEIRNLKSLGISAISVSCIAFSGDEVWIGTYNEGLIRMNRKTGVAKVYKRSSRPNSIAQNAITALHFTDESTLWIALQDNGLNCLNINSEQFAWYSTTSKTTSHLSSDIVVSFIEDSYGTLWAGTEHGINAISPRDNKIYSFNKLPSGSIDIVYGIVEDKQKNLWFSTNKGLYSIKLLPPEILFNQPKKADRLIENSLRNFDENNGLPANEFNQGAYFIDSSGTIYFGGINGMVVFRPEQLLSKAKPNTFLYISSFNLFDKRLKLDTLINYKKEIKLNYNQNYFSIEFVSPNYLNPDKTRYKYILEGLDKDWTISPYQNKVSYSNVSPGTYTFRLQVTDSNGKIAQEEKSFRVIISSPLWESKIFYLAIILLFLLGLKVFTEYRERNLRRNNLVLEEMVKKRTADVIEQKDLVEKKSKALEEALYNINENVIYSEKIKQAMLPEIREINKLFPETFVIYCPKMVVSGDFYFFSRQETIQDKPKHAVLGVADCSGHGVPGALMSVIGLTILNDVVELKGITRPSHILDELQLGIKETLRISHDYNFEAESIESAICKFNFETNEMEYACARIPIYIIRDNRLIELKGDNMKIGAGSNNVYERFTNKLFQLEHGDFIYLCTDGFSNQFGGENGKKFKSERFKNMLLNLSTTSFIIQKEQISQIFEQWKGDHVRVDDLLILGFRYTYRKSKENPDYVI